MSPARAVVLTLAATLSVACTPIYWLGVRLFYEKVEIPSERVALDIGYDPTNPGDHKRQLDLYTPEGDDWPTVVFVHGGGWTWGDRAQRFGGEDGRRRAVLTGEKSAPPALAWPAPPTRHGRRRRRI